ncbi:MAG: hypothetical protein M1837_004545 [Sclerophora amabilis]|nr:MAG: hypothetical protein M1837_004545 [Sclerophora amabilis]
MPPKRALAVGVAAKAMKQTNGVRPVSKAATETSRRETTTAAPNKAPGKTSPQAPPKAPTVGKKRKAEREDDNEAPETNGFKRRKDTVPSPNRKTTEQPSHATPDPDAKRTKTAKPRVIVNHAPTKPLNVYVFGGNSGGELGLGAGDAPSNVTRPRLNPRLAAASVGVVQLATGGMHCAALTRDNQILTWGVNDQGALGRDTEWDGGLVDVDQHKDDAKSDDSSDSELGLNPREATPTEIDASDVPEGTIFTQVAAADSATFALTDDGLVWGWGTFRSNDGVLGFSPNQQIERRPTLVSTLKSVTKLVAGSNHVLALTSGGSVYAWGSGQQNQLGRRVVERTKLNSLLPREFGLPRSIVAIGAGAHHSFAIHSNGKAYGWGLNNFGQTGIPEQAGGDGAVIPRPTVVESLSRHGKVICIDGGSHHSIAVTEQGHCLTWGRVDAYATGLKVDGLAPADIIRDDRGGTRILKVPTRVPGVDDAAFATAASDHCLAITSGGAAYSWGFSSEYQTGQGTSDDVECATLVDNTAVRGKKLVWAGAGGQYSILAGEDPPPQLNGH